MRRGWGSGIEIPQWLKPFCFGWLAEGLKCRPFKARRLELHAASVG